LQLCIKKVYNILLKNNLIKPQKKGTLSIYAEFKLDKLILTLSEKMENLLYTVALVLVILWALGFFVYSAGYLIHILLLIAVIAILLRLIKGKTL